MSSRSKNRIGGVVGEGRGEGERRRYQMYINHASQGHVMDNLYRHQLSSSNQSNQFMYVSQETSSPIINPVLATSQTGSTSPVARPQVHSQWHGERPQRRLRPCRGPAWLAWRWRPGGSGGWAALCPAGRLCSTAACRGRDTHTPTPVHSYSHTGMLILSYSHTHMYPHA